MTGTTWLSRHYLQWRDRVAVPAWVLLAVTVGGLLLRAAQYAFDRSLWLDESLLALNILRRSFAELAQPLDLNQAAPLGFLWLVKLVTLGWGDREWALRLVPFIAGLVALVLFAVVARRLLPPVGAAVAVGLFAISDTLIYYSAEVKQYSTDVMTAVLLLWVFIAIARADRPGVLSVLMWSVVGAVAIWLSHPAIFMLAGIGSALMIMAVSQRNGAQMSRLAFVAVVWAVSFIAAYLVVLRPLISNGDLQSYWQASYFSLRPSWLLGTFFGLFADPAGLSQSGIAAAAFLIGSGTMFMQRRAESAGLLLPIAFALAASALQWYPFSGRLLLFLVPSLLVGVAAGAHFILDLAQRQRATWAAWLLIAMLFVQPAYVAGYHLFNPRTKEEIKPVLSYLRSQAQPGDLLYVDWPSQYPLEYYASRYPLNIGRIVSGVDSNEWAAQIRDLRRLRGPRVWILFSHLDGEETEQKRDQLLLGLLDSRGKQLDSYTRPGAGVYLYDLSAEPVDPAQH